LPATVSNWADAARVPFVDVTVTAALADGVAAIVKLVARSVALQTNATLLYADVIDGAKNFDFDFIIVVSGSSLRRIRVCPDAVENGFAESGFCSSIVIGNTSLEQSMHLPAKPLHLKR